MTGVFLTGGFAPHASAQDNPIQKEEAQIPKTPTAPPSFSRRIPEDPYPCKRKILYQKQVLGCDSNLGRDGEKLRPILQGVPEAEAELDTYQKNRKKVQTLAYFGTAGLLIYIGSRIISNTYMQNKDGTYTENGLRFRTVTFWGGLGLTAGTVAFGFATLSQNEKHIENAIQKHNQARPGTPIEIQFSTGFTF